MLAQAGGGDGCSDSDTDSDTGEVEDAGDSTANVQKVPLGPSSAVGEEAGVRIADMAKLQALYVTLMDNLCGKVQHSTPELALADELRKVSRPGAWRLSDRGGQE